MLYKTCVKRRNRDFLAIKYSIIASSNDKILNKYTRLLTTFFGHFLNFDVTIVCIICMMLPNTSNLTSSQVSIHTYLSMYHIRLNKSRFQLSNLLIIRDDGNLLTIWKSPKQLLPSFGASRG